MSRALVKQEAILYGRFVNAAYAMFKRDRTLLRPEPAPGDIPAPYELVAWLNMSDFIFWWRETPKFYGFLARHAQQKHNFVLGIRGTEGWVEWLDDFMARLVKFRQVPDAGRVEHGFEKIYSTLEVVKRCVGMEVAPTAKPSGVPATAPPPTVMADSFAEQLEQVADTLEEPEVMSLAKERRPRRSFVVTGHSLGSALATLFVMENKEKNKFDISTTCTFASPRVGNAEFVRQFNLLPLDSWRIVNRQDLVPKLPLHIPVLFDYEHVETPYDFSSAGVVKDNPGCWHAMSTYLHWLDPSIDVDPECKR